MLKWIFAAGALVGMTVAARAQEPRGFDGVYIGATAGYDIPVSSAHDINSWTRLYPDTSMDAINGAKVGLVGGYNIVTDRLLVGFEGRWQHRFGVATSTNQYGWTPLPTGLIPSGIFSPASAAFGATRFSHSNQGDISVRIGAAFEDVLVFGKVGAGVEDAKTSNLIMVSNSTFFETSARSINPIAVFGGGIEYNFGSAFARIEAEVIAHLGSGETYYTPAANFTVGYRF